MKKTPSAKAVKPNVGIRVWYRRRINKLIDQLKKSILKWIPATYRNGSSARKLERVIERLRKYWGGRFEKEGDKIAETLVKRIDSTSKNALKHSLAEVGFNVDWSNAPQVKNVLASIRQTQVDLIKTIPQSQLDRVAGIVQRGVQAGRDIFAIQKELESGFDISHKRARMIAIDQTNKATMAINRSRYLSVGIKEGIWQHVAGKYTSRKTHVKMHNKRFKLEGEDAGLYDSDVGKNIMPAELPNCFPASMHVTGLPVVMKLYRRFYSGELTELVADNGEVLSVTPNHPILTDRGFVSAGKLNVGDKVVTNSVKGRLGINLYKDGKVPKFDELFDSFNLLTHNTLVLASTEGEFHGDISDSDIDVIDICGFLRDGFKSSTAKEFIEFIFAKTNVREFFTSADSFFNKLTLRSLCTSPSDICRFNDRLSFFFGKFSEPYVISIATVSALDALGCKKSVDSRSGYSIPFRDSKFGRSVEILINNLGGYVSNSRVGLIDTESLSASSENGVFNSDFLTSFGNWNSSVYEFANIVDKRVISSFHGNVYNIETVNGLYNCNYTTVSNCRCSFRAVLPDNFFK